jgi:hypothetical protein
MGNVVFIQRPAMAAHLCRELGRLHRDALRVGLAEVAHFIAVARLSAVETAKGDLVPADELPANLQGLIVGE